MFHGSIVALATPFTADGIDEDALRGLVAWHVAEGTDGFVPCGTTGESPTLSHDEHRRIVTLCVETAAAEGARHGRKVPVIAGTGSNSTAEAIELTRHAKAVGADAALVVTPYYNKPTQEGLYQHFAAIHDAVDLPIVIYNIPTRSVVDMSVATMARLAQLPRIIGVKDATHDLARPVRTRVEIGPEFCQLSGEDGTAAAFLAQGGHGCISVTANVAPRLCSQMQAAWRAGNQVEMARLRDALTPLNDALFLETSPAPVKYGLSLLGRAPARVRLPLIEPTAATCEAVRGALADAGLLAPAAAA